MLIISGLSGNVKVLSDKNKNFDGKLITIPVDGITRIGSASHYEEEVYSTKCKNLAFVGTQNKSISNSCPVDLYTIESGEGFVVFNKEENVAYISESLAYINRMVSTESENLLETLIKHGFMPASININNLLLRNPLDTSKLDNDTHGVFDFQYGDNITGHTLEGIVDLESLDNRLEGHIFKKRGKLTSVCEFEVNYINPNNTVDDLSEDDFNKIGTITLSDFKYDKAKLLLVPLLFKTDKQFKAFEDLMKAEGRTSISISRPCIHGFCVQTVINIPPADDSVNTDSTISKLVIFPSSVAPTLLVNEFE